MKAKYVLLALMCDNKTVEVVEVYDDWMPEWEPVIGAPIPLGVHKQPGCEHVKVLAVLNDQERDLVEILERTNLVHQNMNNPYYRCTQLLEDIIERCIEGAIISPSVHKGKEVVT